MVKLLLKVDAFAIDRLPLERVIGSELVMLFTKSESDELCVMGLKTAMLIVTSSAAVGMASLDQLLAVSQSPPLGSIHETDERTTRRSSVSSQGLDKRLTRTLRRDRCWRRTLGAVMVISGWERQPVRCSRLSQARSG